MKMQSVRKYRETIERLQGICWFDHVISYGAGLACFEDALAKQGKKVTCIDNSKLEKNSYEALVRSPESTNLEYKLKDFLKIKRFQRAELTIFTETAHYYPDDVIIPFIKEICNHTNFLLFSSLPIKLPAITVQDSRNYKGQDKWKKIIESTGMENRSSFPYPHEHAMIFENRYKEIL